MAKSKVEICNVALAMLGASSIRDFNEDNKRARMCDAFYDFVRDYLLSRFDWPFARRLAKLQQVVITDPIPEGWYVYQLPADCATPRDLHPPGSRDKWYIAGKQLYCQKDADVYLRYTRYELNSALYPDTFCNILATGTAVRLCIPLTQDKNLAQVLLGQFNLDLNDAMETEANIGSEYKESDNDPNNELFVTAGGNGGATWESID